jgi:hypothetical protein
LDGTVATAGNASNNICLSQSGTAATALLLNGSTGQTLFTPFWMPAQTAKIAVYNVTGGSNPNFENKTFVGSPIYITSAGNDSGITFAVVGTVLNVDGSSGVISETITGASTSKVASANAYKTIISITPSGNTASTVTVGWMGYAKLDVARQVITTSGGSDTGITITVTGTDWSGAPISESFAGGNPTATSTLSYLTVTSVKVSAATASTILVGTNGIADSPWINFDTWAGGTAACQAVVSGTVNYTVYCSNDDPNSYGNPVAYNAMTWDSNYAGVVAGTASGFFQLSQIPQWLKVRLNSGSGSVTLTAIQQNSVTY